MFLSVASLVALLIYIPSYLKKEEKKDSNIKFKEKYKTNSKINILKELNYQIEESKKSKYYRANLTQLIAKCFAFTSGYPLVTLNELMELIKKDKINLPEDIKNFIVNSMTIYSSFSENDETGIFDNLINKLLKKLKNESKLNKQLIYESIDILYNQLDIK